VPAIIDRTDAAALIARAERLAAAPGRSVLGIVGPPGSGKSTLAAEVVDALAGRAALVPMDGFHLAQRELERLGRTARKGNIDTFDGAGFVALLRRLVDPESGVVYAPEFRRDLEEPIAGALPIEPGLPLLIVEGNYLLVDAPDWREIRPLLDECWYIEPDDGVRLDRLIARHVAFGRTPEQAGAHARGSDEVNARLIASTRDRADVVVRG